MDTPTSPRIAFWGTDSFVLPVLEALHAAGLSPQLVITTPDRPHERTKVPVPSPVKTWALSHAVPVDQPERLKEYSPRGTWDLFIVASYGKIIPQRILDMARFGTLNVHPSLLPKFRGPSPVPSSILAGEVNTGVSIMLLDAEMDHGPLLAEVPYTSDPRETTTTLLPRLFGLGGAALADIVPAWIAGRIVPREQDHSVATYTKKFTGEDGRLDFNTMTGDEIDRRVRALNPEPGTYVMLMNNDRAFRVKVLETKIEHGRLKLVSVQPEGKTPMSWVSFIKRYPQMATSFEAKP